MRTVNVVAYALAGDGSAPRPLISVSEGEPNAAQKIAYAINAAFADAGRRGATLPEVVTVQEVHTGGENDEKSARFFRVDATTLRPSTNDKGEAELSAVLSKKGS